MTRLVVDTTFSAPSGGDLTVQNIENEPVVTIDDANSSALVFTFTGGDYDGVSYSTDYLGANVTAADVAAGPVCLARPVVTGGTADGDTLTITPAVWVYAGDPIDDPVFDQKLDGVEIAYVDGGFGLTHVIEILTDGGKDFTVDETYGGVTVSSVAVGIDAFLGSYMQDAAEGYFWYDPGNVVTGGGLLTSWPNSAKNADPQWDLDTVPAGTTAPAWDAGNSKATSSGSQMLVTGNMGTAYRMLDSVQLRDDGKKIVVMGVFDTTTINPGAMLSFCNNSNTNLSYGFGPTNVSGGVRSYFYAAQFSAKFGSLFGAVATINNPTAGKVLCEWHITDLTAQFFVNGVLEQNLIWDMGTDTIRADCLSIFGRGNAAGTASRSNGSIYTLLATEKISVLDEIRTEMAAAHGITLP